mgnify:CR=1 FL=1
MPGFGSSEQASFAPNENEEVNAQSEADERLNDIAANFNNDFGGPEEGVRTEVVRDGPGGSLGPSLSFDNRVEKKAEEVLAEDDLTTESASVK